MDHAVWLCMCRLASPTGQGALPGALPGCRWHRCRAAAERCGWGSAASATGSVQLVRMHAHTPPRTPPHTSIPPRPFPPPSQQVNVVAVQGRGLHLSIHTLRFVLALSKAAPRLRVELIDSWDSGAPGLNPFASVCRCAVQSSHAPRGLGGGANRERILMVVPRQVWAAL